MARFLFPRWANLLPRRMLLFGFGPVSTAAVIGLWYYGSPRFTDVGYAPVQPVEFSHKLHAGEMGLDCRYCHSTVENASFAAVPPTQTCMNCHAKVRTDSAKLLPVRESWATDEPIEWVRVHNLPDFVYFDHSAHVGAGVGCVSCHGRIDQMERVTQAEPLSMGWCLDCHRDPGPALRPASEVTNMAWQPGAENDPHQDPHKPALSATGREVQPPVHCSGCHR